MHEAEVIAEIGDEECWPFDSHPLALSRLLDLGASKCNSTVSSSSW